MKNKKVIKEPTSYMGKLKLKNWYQWKASRLRSDWTSRAKKGKGDPEDVSTRIDIQEWLLKLEPFKCYLTGEPLCRETMEADHRNPVGRGGSFKISNVAITSKHLNAAKGNMTEDEFRSLLTLIHTWEDNGKQLLSRLKQGSTVFGRSFRWQKKK